MANESFYLIFSENPNKRIKINEPIDFSEVDFNYDQRENGWGRDVTLSGGEVKFRFTLYRHDSEFKKILYYRHKYGFEADVKLIILLSDGTEFIGEIDFATSETNDFNYFSCSVILKSSLQIFRRRSETKVDLFSNVGINGEFIEPLVPQNMLLQAKPTQQESRWSQKSVTTIEQTNLLRYFNITQSIDGTAGINNTLVPYTPVSGSPSDFQILEADSNITNTEMKITNMNIFVQGNARARIYYFKGVSIPSGFTPGDDAVLLLDKGGTDFSINGDIPIVNIGDIQRGEKIWLFLQITQNLANTLVITITSINTRLSVSSVAYNSLVPAFRLIDVMRQIAKSISGLDIYAPRYDFGGEFYDNVLTNGNLLRNVLDKPFYISWDDIEKSIIGEHNSDSEIQPDGRVFHGIYEDYHTNNECGFFDNTQFSGLVKKTNPIYALNEFKFRYEKYQSLKEITEPNSESTIHGESILTPFNQKVENGKEASVKWSRDAILLDVQQRLSTVVKEDTATQDDDTIFAIDTIATVDDQQFTETTTLQHTFNSPYLSLKTNGAVNFLVLGIRSGTVFTIEYPDPNFGDYSVYAVTNTELQLSKISSPPNTSASNGLRPTKYKYEIKKETIPLTNRTDEGFDLVLNLSTPDKYSNMRYSVERNIRNYWNQFLATVNLYWKDKPIKNTYYKNNGKCETEYAGLRITEKEDFIPTDPIVTPDMYEEVVFANVEFKDFIALQNKIRALRGYIRTIDNNNRVLKLYSINMSYENKSRQLTLSGQEKFEKSYLSITSESGLITINEETVLRKLTYEIVEEQKVVLFDLERQRLYNEIWWDKVSVNNALAPTLEVLKEWLDLLG